MHDVKLGRKRRERKQLSPTLEYLHYSQRVCEDEKKKKKKTERGL